MNIKIISAAVLAGSALVFSSCEPLNYGTWAVSTDGYHTSVAWTNASYDANGFPIYGYYYGRPVYGYTETGAPVFTFAALTALCYVPHWGPAPWYHGHWHYPVHIHRAPAPPHFPSGHRPSVRPQGGMNAPVHRTPASVMGPARNAPKPAAPKPGAGGFGNNARPSMPNARPSLPNHNSAARPSMPNYNRNAQPAAQKPAFGGFGNNARPSQPSARPSQPAARPSQPSARPSQPAARPSQPSAPPSQPAARPSAPSSHGAPAARPSHNSGSDSSARPSRSASSNFGTHHSRPGRR